LEWDVDYVLGLARNSRLQKRIEEAMDEAEATAPAAERRVAIGES
jgi:hypothetical protein